jgi:hypothetical protein
MKWIKRLWYSLWLWNALHAIGEIRPKVTAQDTPLRRKRMLREALRHWKTRAKKWQSRIDALDTPDDDSEQLSKRAIPAPMYWHK